MRHANARPACALEQMIALAAQTNAAVLITGEPGAGKQRIARAVHARSRRADRPLLSLDARTLAPAALEDALFGHVAGAFGAGSVDQAGLLELAHLSALQMDGVASLPLAQQRRLLRAIESGETSRQGSPTARPVDVRIIATTSANLAHESEAGRFDHRLALCLSTIDIHVPALRDRRAEIPIIARRLLAEHNRRHKREVTDFDRDAMDRLTGHAWPGNLREIDRVIELAVLSARRHVISVHDLLIRTEGEPPPRFEDMSLSEVERFLIRSAVARSGGHTGRAAVALGLTRGALIQRLRRCAVRESSDIDA